MAGAHAAWVQPAGFRYLVTAGAPDREAVASGPWRPSEHGVTMQHPIADLERSFGCCVPLRVVVIREEMMNGLIYLIGLIVVVLFILSFLGLR